MIPSPSRTPQKHRCRQAALVILVAVALAAYARTTLTITALIALGALSLVLSGAAVGLLLRARERGKFEATLRKSEERFCQVVEFAPNAKVLIGADGRIQLVNAQTERLFGYSRAELLGEPVEMLVPDRYRAAHPGLRSGFFANPVSRPMGVGRTFSPSGRMVANFQSRSG